MRKNLVVLQVQEGDRTDQFTMHPPPPKKNRTDQFERDNVLQKLFHDLIPCDGLPIQRGGAQLTHQLL